MVPHATFYALNTGKHKFIKHNASNVRDSTPKPHVAKSGAKSKVSHPKSESGKSSPNFQTTKSTRSKHINVNKRRWDSFESNSSVGGTRKRKHHLLKNNMNDIIKIKDMDRDAKTIQAHWDALPHSQSSGRNQNNFKLNVYSKAKDYIKNTMNHDRSELRLENSHEVDNYSTIVPGQKSHLSKTKENDLRNETDLINIKRHKKSSIKPKKGFNDRLHDTASIYKNSSLNIAHFLSTYTAQIAQGGIQKKRRKSRKSITTVSNYKTEPFKKVNDRSRSNKYINDYVNQVCRPLLY